MFSLKSLRIIVKRCIYNHQGTLDLGFRALWHLLVNIFLPSLAVGYALFTCGTAKTTSHILWRKFCVWLLRFWALFTAIWQEVLLVLHLQWFVCQTFCLLWCMKRTNESPFSCNISPAHKTLFFQTLITGVISCLHSFMSEVLFCLLLQLHLFQVPYVF